MTQRYKLTIEYDGTPFVGWQAQENGVSVQSTLEAAIKALCGEEQRVFGAGRTDVGVHARGQVAHFDMTEPMPLKNVRDGLNHHLRDSGVAVIDVAFVDDTFDARFSARARHYEYKILNRRAPAVLDKNRVWHVPQPLDIAAMQSAANILIGKHDFTTFRSVQCQSKSPVKTLDAIEVTKNGEIISIRVSARSFLHKQVRSIVGCLQLVGLGRWTIADMKAALEACDRETLGFCAPARGLYLMQVDYSDTATG